MGDSAQIKPASTGIFYGWIIVFAAFIAFGMVYGTVLYSFAVFATPVAKAFGAKPAQIQLAFFATNVGTGILGIFAGRLLAKYSKRNCIVAGLVVMAASFYLLSLTTMLWQFIALYGVIVAFGAALAAPMGAAAIVNNWFIRNRGRALTAATLGTSVGQMTIPKLAAFVIAGWSWQIAYQAFAAALILVAVPIIFLLVKDRPEDKGMKAYGADHPDTVAAGAPPAVLTTSQVLARGDFWSIGVGFLLCVVVYLALSATMVAYAVATFGVTNLEAANLVLTMGIAGVIGKFCFAAWTDRMGLRNTLWVAAALNAMALVLLLAVPNFNMAYLAAACVGGSAGGVLPVWPGLVAFRFGRNAMPQVMGLMGPIVVSLQGFGAPLAAQLHYKLAFELFLGFLVASVIITRNLNKPASV